jgi:hypothetical protein
MLPLLLSMLRLRKGVCGCLKHATGTFKLETFDYGVWDHYKYYQQSTQSKVAITVLTITISPFLIIIAHIVILRPF